MKKISSIFSVSIISTVLLTACESREFNKSENTALPDQPAVSPDDVDGFLPISDNVKMRILSSGSECTIPKSGMRANIVVKSSDGSAAIQLLDKRYFDCGGDGIKLLGPGSRWTIQLSDFIGRQPNAKKTP